MRKKLSPISMTLSVIAIVLSVWVLCECANPLPRGQYHQQHDHALAAYGKHAIAYCENDDCRNMAAEVLRTWCEHARTPGSPACVALANLEGEIENRRYVHWRTHEE
jgi:hypothetical protein